MHRVTLIPGDGIGPEVTAAAVRVVAAAGAPVAWERMEAGNDVMTKYGTPVPDEVVNAISRNRVALKGPLTTPIGGGFASANVTFRKRLNLYANVRPARTLPGVRSRYEKVDLVVIRENSEDLYAGLEHIVVPGVVESLKIITEAASLRIGRFAFEFAQRWGRLRHLGEAQAAGRIESAVLAVLAEGRHLTRDLGGTATTTEVTDAIIAHL